MKPVRFLLISTIITLACATALPVNSAEFAKGDKVWSKNVETALLAEPSPLAATQATVGFQQTLVTAAWAWKDQAAVLLVKPIAEFAAGWPTLAMESTIVNAPAELLQQHGLLAADPAAPLVLSEEDTARLLAGLKQGGAQINQTTQTTPGEEGFVYVGFTEDDYDAVLDLNLKSCVFVSQAVVSRMVEQQVKGSLIHMSSQMGHVSGPNRSLYSASKWGLEGFNKGLALDVAKFGIRSNTICPTFIETPMTRPFFEDKAFLDSVLGKIKLGRHGTVEDLMGAIVFLASDASSLMTGTSMIIDGGWTAD